jgi:8-oxo-dGTP pyrophosphatase MutT (NUDIX family)
LYNFSLVVCRHPVTGKFLLCQEFANQGFWLPGGAVDGGETFQDAAKRETMEEAGMPVDLKGILGIEYNPCGRIGRDGNHYLVRMRVIFYAEPSEEGLRMFPKSSPDFESAGACWCSVDELKDIKLRGGEPKQWAR